MRTYQPFYGRVIAVVDQTTTVGVDLLPENAIAGTVTDGLRTPVAGAWIEAALDFQDGRPPERSSARSEDDGTFRVGSLGEGPYELRVRCEGFAERTVPGVEVNRTVPIVLERLGAVAGWVLTAETGAPIPQYRLQLVAAGRGREDQRRGGPEGQGGPGGFGGRGGRERRDINDPSGAFLIENLAPGEYELQVSAEGHSSAALPVTIAEGLLTDGVRVFLHSGLVLAGIVTSEVGNAPVPNAQIFLVPNSRQETGGSADGSGADGSGADGRGGGAGGAADRRAERRDQMAERRVTRTERTEQDQSASAQMAQAAIAAATRGGNALATSDEAGAFELKDVPDGRYVLVVRHEALVTGTRDVEIAEGRFENPVRIVLRRGEALQGTVALADGSAAAGAIVSVRDSAGVSKTARVDASGGYVIQGLSRGPYRLSIRGSGLRSSAVEIQVKAGDNRFDYRQDREQVEPASGRG